MTDATNGDDEVCEHDGGQGAADDGEKERRHERDGIAILREGVIRELVIRKALTLNGGALGA